jgi:hypothetical protein
MNYEFKKRERLQYFYNLLDAIFDLISRIERCLQINANRKK